MALPLTGRAAVTYLVEKYKALNSLLTHAESETSADSMTLSYFSCSCLADALPKGVFKRDSKGFLSWPAFSAFLAGRLEAFPPASKTGGGGFIAAIAGFLKSFPPRRRAKLTLGGKNKPRNRLSVTRELLGRVLDEQAQRLIMIHSPDRHNGSK
jgi:hypothetical protein